ncbi:hypothetical protein AAG570_001457 [Ranatra chinensis]|uniref:Uncharacterized protein n=1 Tax=Ranatra chinensis TaxID=642074 RepID=A0ABD0Y9E3_9HEMI
MASKRRSMFHKNKTQETTEKGKETIFGQRRLAATRPCRERLWWGWGPHQPEAPSRPQSLSESRGGGARARLSEWSSLLADCDALCVGSGHTYGPLDGSLYATVVKKSATCPGTAGVPASSTGGGVINSPHTVSMDSGISSAGNGLHHQPPHHRHGPRAPAAAPGTAELDRLLDDMLMTVRDIPDLGGDESIPYHARQDSRPFTYGHLASPGLVRKAATPPPVAAPGLSPLAAPGLSPTAASSPLATPQRPPSGDETPSRAPPTSPDFHEG